MIDYNPRCISEANHRFALEQSGERMLFVIGLNPSTADEHKPDATMRSVLRFVNTCGYDGFVMMNLSSQRSTSPNNMAKELNEDMHKKNLEEITLLSNKYPRADILLAFGNNIKCRSYLNICFLDIYDILSKHCTWLRIGGEKGLTKQGHPRHPLYAKSQCGFVNFDIESYVNGCRR